MANEEGPIVKLTHPEINSGNPVRVMCQKVTVGGKKNVDSKPNANIDGPVEVQTLAYENLSINLTGVRFMNITTNDLSSTTANPRNTIQTLTYPHLLTLYKEAYDGTSGTQIVLNVSYGRNGDITDLVGLSNSANIPVVIESFSLPIDTAATKGGYLPIGNIILRETL